jgi:hypothetical protein
MTAREIISVAVDRGWLAIGGRTPDASLAGRLYTDMQRNGEKSPFIQVGPRTYALREWQKEHREIERAVSRLREALLKLHIDMLRDRIYRCLINLKEDIRSDFIRKLMGRMRTAGANVTNNLLLLGVRLGQAETASATDIALLLRYYRINQPGIFDVAVAVIEEFPEVSSALSTVLSEIPEKNGRFARR